MKGGPRRWYNQMEEEKKKKEKEKKNSWDVYLAGLTRSKPVHRLSSCIF